MTGIGKGHTEPRDVKPLPNCLFVAWLQGEIEGDKKEGERSSIVAAGFCGENVSKMRWDVSVVG